MDKVFINGLQLPTLIGVYDWEREQLTTLIVDLELAWDNSKPAENDDLSLALDYAVVTERICEHAKQQQFLLLESLAESIANLLKTEFNIHWLALKITKPGILDNAAAVGISIERGQWRG